MKILGNILQEVYWRHPVCERDGRGQGKGGLVCEPQDR